MNKNNLPEDAKAELLGKLREPANPIMTQVVRVDESASSATPSAPESLPVELLEQFNAKVPANLLRRARCHKADTRKTLNQITTEALAMYLDAVDLQGSKPKTA